MEQVSHCNYPQVELSVPEGNLFRNSHPKRSGSDSAVAQLGV